MTLTPELVISTARTMMGTKYVHGGRHPKLGLDCTGLPAATATMIDYPFVDVTNYSPIPDGQLLDHLRRNGDEVPVTRMPRRERRTGLIPVDDLRPSDLVAFWLDHTSRVAQHVAILTHYPGGLFDLGMIHVYSHVEKVVEHALDREWRYRMLAAFRWRGMTWPG